ncbi:zf-HC2 domain-containing protein [Oscillospiraceae bacterium 44-5]
MKHEVECGVIRDLLPLYEDGAASEETTQLVREHIKDCPACREELRKMRVPVSMPAEADGELWERYKRRQDQLRRKKNFRTACVLFLLAAMAVFCLCYTLIPRSWNQVSGVTEPDRVMGTYTHTTFQRGSPELDIWWLNNASGAALTGVVMDALNSVPYRAELGNLLSYIPFLSQNTSVEWSEGTVVLDVVKDNATVANIILYNMGKDCEVHVDIWNQPYGTFIYHTDREMFDQISAIICEYGEKP